ncbi:MAG TPA: dTDP-glucose 4,6-dehydratase [Oscillatoriaceae cyanobacterium]
MARAKPRQEDVPLRIIVTGGAGFIGSNFVRMLLNEHPEHEVTVLDALTYAGNLASLEDLQSIPRFRFVHGDICDAPLVDSLAAKADAIVHFAAESHVDRSISDPGIFVQTNVQGTLTLLEAAKKHKLTRFVHVSTDEVYGSLGPTGLFTEETPIAPNSPYSASKASSDLMARAYHETFGLPVMITRCSNNYGPYQFPEKLIPFFIASLLDGASVPVYGDGLNVRDWLHVEDHCQAISLVLHRGVPGEVYNIGGNNERTNLAITQLLIEKLGRDERAIKYVQDRPGHDRRYAIDASKITRELGWKPKYTFETGIAQTIEWYLANRDWWEPLRSRGLDSKRAAANQVSAK